MNDDPRLAKYTQNVQNQERRFPPASRFDLYMHFGHFEDPAHAQARNFGAAQERLNLELAAMADLGTGDRLRLLDVGCGFGGTIASLNEHLDGAVLTGLNLDPRQLAFAARAVQPRPGNKTAWVHGDACALPFADESFDRIFAVECVVHFSRRRFLAEAARVLVPGGRLVISDFVPDRRLLEVRDAGDLPMPAQTFNALFESWDDLWGHDAVYPELAAAAGLELSQRVDANAPTLPSCNIILGRHAIGAMSDETLDVETRSMLALRWLQERGLLRMEYLALQRSQHLVTPEEYEAEKPFKPKFDVQSGRGQ